MALQSLLERSLTRFFEAECLRYSGRDQMRISDRRQRDQEDSVGEIRKRICRSLNTEARLASASWTRQRQQAHVLSRYEFFDLGQFSVAADEQS